MLFMQNKIQKERVAENQSSCILHNHCFELWFLHSSTKIHCAPKQTICAVPELIEQINLKLGTFFG
jgi:hypothetical protein